MGTWGVGGFENDQASDWSFEFDGVDLETGQKLIRDALNFDAAFAQGDPDCAEVLAVAAAELVILVNGHAVPEAPDTHHLDEIDEDDEDAEPLSLEEIVAQTEAETRSLGIAIAESIGRPGEVFSFEETEVFYKRPGEERTTVVRWERGQTQPQYETRDEDEDEYEDAIGWLARTHPPSDPSLTDLARRAIARVTGPGSCLAELWDEAFDPADTPIWRSYMAALAAKLADEPVRPS